MILAVFEQQYGTRLQCKHPWLPTPTPCDSVCLRPGKSLGRWDEFSLQTLASGYEMTKFTFSHAKQCVARFLPSIFNSTERKIYIAGKCGKHRTRTETEAQASRESRSSADGIWWGKSVGHANKYCRSYWTETSNLWNAMSCECGWRCAERVWNLFCGW